MNADVSLGLPGITHGARIEDNVIYDNGTGGGSGINMDGVQDSTIQNNLIYNEHGTGIALFQIDAAGPSMNNTVANNTGRGCRRWAVGRTDR